MVFQKKVRHILTQKNTIVDVDDYVVTDYIVSEEYLTKAMFMKDSFKYSRRVDNMYICKADIVEVLN